MFCVKCVYIFVQPISRTFFILHNLNSVPITQQLLIALPHPGSHHSGFCLQESGCPGDSGSAVTQHLSFCAWLISLSIVSSFLSPSNTSLCVCAAFFYPPTCQRILRLARWSAVVSGAAVSSGDIRSSVRSQFFQMYT